MPTQNRAERDGQERTRRAAQRCAAGGEHQNVFDELKNQWGFSGLCSQKAAVSQSSARMLLLIPAQMLLSGRRKIVKLAVGGKFDNFLKQAYQRPERWLSQTAPQLTLTMGKSPPWLLFDPTQATSSAHT